MYQSITCLYFSPTHTTRLVTTTIAETIGKKLAIPVRIQSFNTPKMREEPPVFSNQEIVVCGVPVYAGRIPNLMLPYLKQVVGNGALAIPIVLFGNRSYDDALMELSLLLESDGFKILGGGAFVGEHSFSTVLAANRPSKSDLDMACDFGMELANKVGHIAEGEQEISKICLPGNNPVGPYYTPRDHVGETIDIRRVKPKTQDTCTSCGHCVSICPMGSISEKDPSQIIGLCIKCGACVKECPIGAKYYDDTNYLYHKKELEDMYTKPKNNEVYL